LINLKAKWASGPYIVWMILFTIIPMLMILYYAFTDNNGAFTFDNIVSAWDYVPTLIRSIWLALIATVVCLIMAFPFAYAISRKPMSKQKMFVMLVMLPMWMNFLLRTHALAQLFEDNGIINTALQAIGLGKLQIMGTEFAVVVGMIYNFLPFMILPLYSIMTKIDQSLIESAHDLGANNLQVLFKILLPLSVPGIVSGITMVFVPAVSTFVISKFLGGTGFFLIGDAIESQILGNTYNLHTGSATSLILMVIVIITMLIFSRIDTDELEETLA